MGPPDFVIEIVSPSSAGIDRVRKAATYATFGVPEYWIVDPHDQSILVQALEGSRYQPVSTEAGLIRSQVVHDLVVDPQDVFRVPAWMEK